MQESIHKSEIDGDIIFVFSNREPGESTESDLFFQLVDGYHIPLVCFSSKKFKAANSKNHHISTRSRIEYDREVMQSLRRFAPDICVLAGYMLIVGQDMCQKYTMINLHPAAPGGPAGTWQEVTWKLIETRASETGAMMHLVTPELDKGPPITYCTFPIRGEVFDNYWEVTDSLSVAKLKEEQGENNMLFQLIRQHGLAREFPLILSTLKAFGQGKIKIEAGEVIDNQGKPISGYDLTEDVDRMIK